MSDAMELYEHFGKERVLRAKRLTDAELAAEVWHECEERTRTAMYVMYGDLNNKHVQAAFQRAIDRVIVLHRFATTAHYDEVA